MTAAEQYLHAHVGLQAVMPTLPFHGSTAAAALTVVNMQVRNIVRPHVTLRILWPLPLKSYYF